MTGLAKSLGQIRGCFAIVLDDQNTHGLHNSPAAFRTAGRIVRSALPRRAAKLAGGDECSRASRTHRAGSALGRATVVIATAIVQKSSPRWRENRRAEPTRMIYVRRRYGALTRG